MYLRNQIAVNTRVSVSSGERSIDALASIFESMTRFSPRDKSARMLIAQMISVHEAAME